MQLLDLQLLDKDFRSWIKACENEHVLEIESLFYSWNHILRKPKKSINLGFDLLELRGDQTYVIRLTGWQIKLMYLVSSYHINRPQDPKKYANKNFASCRSSVRPCQDCLQAAAVQNQWEFGHERIMHMLLPFCQQNYMPSPKRNICTIIRSETCKDNPMDIICSFLAYKLKPC